MRTRTSPAKCCNELVNLVGEDAEDIGFHIDSHRARSTRRLGSSGDGKKLLVRRRVMRSWMSPESVAQTFSGALVTVSTDCGSSPGSD